jgi:Holliday junction resolvasome RuvABC DNA-binding subunit
MATELGELNERITAFDAEIKGLARSDPDMKRLIEIPGIGPMIASALVAAMAMAASKTLFNGEGWAQRSFRAFNTNVPEPATLAIFGLGVVETGLLRRRRKRST